MKHRHFLCAGLAALVLGLAGTPSWAADHAESPGPTGDPAADIADVYLFRAPDRPNRLVAAMSFGNRPLPLTRIDFGFFCDPRVLYTFNFDNDGGDVNPVRSVRARLGRSARGNCGLQLEAVPGATATFSGPAETVFTSPGGLRAFAGLRDDPFFFDFPGFVATLGTFGASDVSSGTLEFATVKAVPAFSKGRDGFKGRNASIIVFEMDLDAIAPVPPGGGPRPTVRFWGTTSRLVE
ncbi:DUF4331 domain-containing protein [Solimonas sp. K1W22B-7]|uniref:DUF4331 family protein n=1 Tax=Solimonas sp. K1W22B-7 TaxID=2303331 RepID=UPI000E331852|nr:DUF4331 family protein [Solimonas sp. K1W22B-7]AXQ28671.1 DUF4331 domain-containing protein [Solimonas sp. K1W22B-7]